MPVESLATNLKGNEVSRTSTLFPEFLKGNAQKMISFLEDYYRFMSEGGGVSELRITNGGEGYTENKTNCETTGGSGFGLTVDIFTNETGNVSSIIVNQEGLGYSIGDVIYVRINGEDTPCQLEIIELTANPSYIINRLVTEHDIDNASETNLDNIKREIAATVPAFNVEDQRTLFKRIISYYNTRGSFDSARTFFKVFFGDDITVRNANTFDTAEPEFKYILVTGVPPIEWVDSYNKLVHPAGTQYLIDFIIESFADNFFFSNTNLNIPEGWDTIDYSDSDWLDNIVLEAGNHSPFRQYGIPFVGIRIILEFIAYTDSLLQENLLKTGSTTYSHESGLVIKNIDDNYESAILGCAKSLKILNTRLHDGQTNPTFVSREAPIFLGRERNMMKMAVSEEPTDDITAEVIAANPKVSFFWETNYLHVITAVNESSINPATGKRLTRSVAHRPDQSLYELGETPTPVVLFDGYDDGVLKTNSVEGLTALEDLNEITVHTAREIIPIPNLESGIRVNVHEVVTEDYKIGFSYEGNNLESDEPYALSFLIKDPNRTSPYNIILNQISYTIEPDQDGLAWVQIPFIHMGGGIPLIEAIFPSQSEQWTLHDLCCLKGGVFNEIRPAYDRKAMLDLSQEDLREFSLQDVDGNTAGGEIAQKNDGTLVVEVTCTAELNEAVELQLTDGDVIYTYEDEFENESIKEFDRFIAWSTSFENLTRFEIPTTWDDDIYQIVDFGEAPILDSVQSLTYSVDHKHGDRDHKDGGISLGASSFLRNDQDINYDSDINWDDAGSEGMTIIRYHDTKNYFGDSYINSII